MMTDLQAKRILEALLLISEKPLELPQAQEVLGAEMETARVRQLLTEMIQEYVSNQRGLRIVEVANGFQLVTDPELAPYVQKLNRRVRSVRLSRPALESLAIVAYRQPITRIEIERVRGVDVAGVLETLLKISFIRVMGRKDVVGRPILYGTTKEFLEHFGLKQLDDLPSLEELKGSLPVPPVEPTSPVSTDANQELKPRELESTTQAD